MSIENDIRSLNARVSKLTTALERSANAMVESSEWCADVSSDVAALMADMREMKRAMKATCSLIVGISSIVNDKEELKTTAAYPVASGAYDTQIVAMHNGGASDIEIGKAICCDASTVRRRRIAIGCNEGSRKVWSERENDILREACKSCSSFREVAECLPGRSYAACMSHAAKLGVRIREPMKRWTEEDDEYLVDVWESASADIYEISCKLGRTPTSVHARAKTLGLTRSRKRLNAIRKKENDRRYENGMAVQRRRCSRRIREALGAVDG